MTCRRKLKSERELVADIRKCFHTFCQQRECSNCEFDGIMNCAGAYVISLLSSHPEEIDESDLQLLLNDEEDW